MRVHPANFKSQRLYWQVPIIVLLLFASMFFSIWQLFSKPKIKIVEKVIEKKVIIKEPCEACAPCETCELQETNEKTQAEILDELKQ